MQILRLMLLMTVGGIVAGCGQKGPLVLPDAQRPHKQIGIPRAPAAKPAPAAPTPVGPGAPAAPLPAPATPEGSPADPTAAAQS